MAQQLTREQRYLHLLTTAVSIANASNTVMVTYEILASTCDVTVATVRAHFGNKNVLWQSIARHDKASVLVRENAAAIGII